MRHLLCFLLSFLIGVIKCSNDNTNFPSIGNVDKRFSMNYLDLVEPNNPKSWQNTLPKSSNEKRHLVKGIHHGRGDEVLGKRFSMNFLDTIGDSDPRSWQNTMSNPPNQNSNSGGVIVRKDDSQRKRSRSTTFGARPMLNFALASSTLESIDILFQKIIETEGTDGICNNAIMLKLLTIRNTLSWITRNRENSRTAGNLYSC